jgi:predicted TIM-barrel fold metal-dependent hydrolase
MGRIVDSEAHAWVRIPNNWRHRSSPDEPRSPLGPRAAACYRPSRPAADGSYPPPEDTSDDLLAAMDRHGIDMSVIYPGAHMSSNDEIARVVASAPGRLIGFGKYGAAVPPFQSRQERQAAYDEIEHGLRDLGFRGIGEMSCEQWWPEPPEAAIDGLYPMFELCKTYGACVVVHAHAGGGAKNVRYCDPDLFRPVIADFPTVPLILNHMGGAREDFFAAALDVARRHDNVRFNTSQTTPENLSQAVRTIGAERIFFGTDFYALERPETAEVNQHRKQLSIVERAKMSERERELVLGEAIAAFLDLPN